MTWDCGWAEAVAWIGVRLGGLFILGTVVEVEVVIGSCRHTSNCVWTGCWDWELWSD